MALERTCADVEVDWLRSASERGFRSCGANVENALRNESAQADMQRVIRLASSVSQAERIAQLMEGRIFRCCTRHASRREDRTTVTGPAVFEFASEAHESGG